MTAARRARHRSQIISRLRNAGCVFPAAEARLLVSSARTPAELADMVDRRVAGLPLEHIVGWAEFCGLRIAVDPGVFVPRRRSEFLVEQAAGAAPRDAVIVDLCCGSGAIGAALVAMSRSAELYAVDIDPAAVCCARRNLARRNLASRDHALAEVYLGDLYEPLPGTLEGRVDLLVANAPYVPTAALDLMPPEARLHEPPAALDGGLDGLDVQRRVAAGASRWLAPGGHLLMETSEVQASRTAAAFAGFGLHPRVARSERHDAAVVIGTRRSA